MQRRKMGCVDCIKETGMGKMELAKQSKLVLCPHHFHGLSTLQADLPVLGPPLLLL